MFVIRLLMYARNAPFICAIKINSEAVLVKYIIHQKLDLR